MDENVNAQTPSVTLRVPPPSHRSFTAEGG